MNHDGSHLFNEQQIFAPLRCIICFQRVEYVRKYSGIPRYFKPRRAPRERPHGIFQLV